MTLSKPDLLPDVFQVALGFGFKSVFSASRVVHALWAMPEAEDERLTRTV